MASLPGYYISSPAAIVYLPVREKHTAQLGEARGDISIETDGGKNWVYNQFKRTMESLTFRVNGTQLAAFKAMHDALNGQSTAFYYVDSDGLTFYCRKQQDFLYTRIGSAPPYLYDVTLNLKGEPTDAEIGA